MIFAAEQELDQPHRSEPALLDGPCRWVGYYWTGRLEYIHDEPALAFSNVW